MNLQLFPNSCGFDVAEYWCGLTDVSVWIALIILTIMFYLLYQALKYARTIIMRRK